MSASSLLFHALPSFFFSQFFRHPKVPVTDCAGKTIIVTGANTGLGKEAARHFVQLGAAKVIIACRTVSKGEDAKHDIEQSTKRAGVIEVWPLDLSDYESVSAFATRVEGLPRIDVFLENAGVSTSQFVMVGGNESTITVNVVSTFLLALLVLPKLRADAKEFNFTPTLTIVSSEVHEFTPFKEGKETELFLALNDEKKAIMGDRYNVSKLLEVFTCRQIAQDHPVKQLDVTLNFVNPGFCHSELMREIDNPVVKLAKAILCRTTEVGSRTLVDAAISHGPETHGQYLSNQRVTPVAPLVRGTGGAELQKRVWDELAQKLEQIQPGILSNLS